MTNVVFIGPTISKTEVLSVIDAICLPPVAQGDIYRAMCYEPKCIGIIDGYFDGVAAVWHKEILWAMSQGVHVFGAASMGALRAAELTDFGMIGVGEIFNQYRENLLEDDDEVAVIHGPAELGFPTLSEPMVNIRATLRHAHKHIKITQSETVQIETEAKLLQFRKRNWGNLIKAANIGTNTATWIQQNLIDQKRRDALQLLQEVKEVAAGNIVAPAISFDFEWTNQWDRATRQWDREEGDLSIKEQQVLDEVRLIPDEFLIISVAAKLSYATQHPHLARNYSEPQNSDLQATINDFRERLNLFSRSQLDHWLEENELSQVKLEKLLADELRRETNLDTSSNQFHRHLLNHLKLEGQYHSYRMNAKNKNEFLPPIAQGSTSIRTAGLPKPALLEWYFRNRLNSNIPKYIDRHINLIGLSTRDEFYQMLAREYLFRQGKGDK